MRRLDKLVSCVTVSLSLLVSLGHAQSSGQKPPTQKPPELIRDTGVAEGKTDVETAKKKEYSPLKSEQNLKIGDYYFKQKNYIAAIGRYQDALEYQPNSIAAYESLGRAYEKNGDKNKAVVLYKDFLKNFPQSPKASDFKSRLARLEKKK